MYLEYFIFHFQDFANAIYKMCQAGYKGKHGHFDVPEQILQQMNALYMQITVGDYGRLFRNCWFT